MKGSLLTETVFSLLIISILLVFIFDSSTTSLSHANKIELESEVTSLLNFVYGYLSKYELKHDISQITPQVINAEYRSDTDIGYPRVVSLSSQMIQQREITVNGQRKTIKYRIVTVQIEREAGKTSTHTLIFGL